MKTQSLLESLGNVLKDDKKKHKQIDSLKKVLAKLKHKKNSLRKKSAQASGVEKKKIDKKLHLIHAQRKKGLKALKHLKSKK
ncbi:hypothetical protein [Magnetospira sp. QH-2]|uniref:hypothetical protein n=1 Tax=Magnetospira sp. (strain QH-2) TaxID=1288970 RepID=UPI0003E81739|nr:hypothetical protein [Magnetospira sp. QH-2]CCQ74162.1 Conserved protein of unknown function [Magnetospira sp. QH-2]